MNCLLSGALGDMVGLRFEGFTSDNDELVAWDGKEVLPSVYHNLPLGAFSDDTVFSKALTESLLEMDKDAYFIDIVENNAKKYLENFKKYPARGYGRATKKAMKNLEEGKSFADSGIVDTYGNGSMMRIAPIGVYIDNIYTLTNLTIADASITHNNQNCQFATLAIALMAYAIRKIKSDQKLDFVIDNIQGEPKQKLLQVRELLDSSITYEEAMKVFGTKCNVLETLPCVFYTFMRFYDAHYGLTKMIKAGGDVDSNASILASFYGIENKISHFPKEWFSILEEKEELTTLDEKLCKKVK